MYRSFGFLKDNPAIVGLFLFNDVWQPVDHVIQWAMKLSSRRNEYGAGISLAFSMTHLDQFALKLGYKNELARALIKLQIKNLSEMDADWLYSAYNHSHPILAERLRALGYNPSEDIVQDKKDKAENEKIE
jgi:STE24 endopeptidase